IETLSGQPKIYSVKSACPVCGFSFPDLEPRFFSFNNPRGACPECDGMGYIEYEYENEDGEIEEEYDIEVCPECEGKRLKPEVLKVELGGKNIAELSSMSADHLHRFLSELQLGTTESMI